MSGPELGSGPGSPQTAVVDQALSSPSVNDPGQQNPTTTSTGNESHPATTEKTISCISCRGRKLKCDRVKPKCGTCTRLRHNICEYPERRRNVSTRRRNMKDLEARLAQVETKLVSDNAKSSTPEQIPWIESGQNEWDNIPVDMNIDFGSDAFMDRQFAIPDTFKASVPSTGLWTQAACSGLDIQEPLPPADMVNELHQIYFDKMHYTLPMIHQQRYLAALDLPVHMQPPPCLRYAIWATAASISDKYSQYEDMLYERARRYADAAEMKDHGERFATVQYAQTCGLIATYEARKAYFTRAWMTIGRMVRLVQMLLLHRLDDQGRSAEPTRYILPPPQDFIELEERRRTFWVAFHGDRWSSAGTGWAMLIQEKDVTTHLPSSEEAFESGIMESGISLAEALTPAGVSRISIFGSYILSACLFGHNFAHIHQTSPEDCPDDFANGEFWKRHRTMDNVLSNTFLFLPENLRLPGGIRDMRIAFLHMSLHTAAICLHQTAMVTAERNNLNLNFIKHLRSRILIAAEEIANIMRLVSHVDVSNMNPWTGFSLYAAATVFIQEARGPDKSASSLSNLEFLIAAMKALGNRHSITTYFTAELEIDIQESGILDSAESIMANIPSNEYMPERCNAPMTIYNLCRYIQAKGPVEARIKGPLLAGILSRSERGLSPRGSPASGPTNSTPSSKYIEAPTDSHDGTTSLPTRPNSLLAFNTSADSPPIPQYGHRLVNDFVMFQHDSNQPMS